MTTRSLKILSSAALVVIMSILGVQKASAIIAKPSVPPIVRPLYISSLKSLLGSVEKKPLSESPLILQSLAQKLSIDFGNPRTNNTYFTLNFYTESNWNDKKLHPVTVEWVEGGQKYYFGPFNASLSKLIREAKDLKRGQYIQNLSYILNSKEVTVPKIDITYNNVPDNYYYSIRLNGNQVGTVKGNVMPYIVSDVVKVLTQTTTKAYVVHELGQGVSGELYSIDLSNGSFKKEMDSFRGISSDNKVLAGIDQAERVITLQNIENSNFKTVKFQTASSSVSTNVVYIDRIVFSADNQKIAYVETVKAKDNYLSAVYIYDITTGVVNKIAEENKPTEFFVINKWKDAVSVDYSSVDEKSRMAY